MNNMKKCTRIFAILLSMALMLTMAVPIAFAEDTAQVSDAENVQVENTGEAEEYADPEQNIDESVDKEVVSEEPADEIQDSITVEEINLDEDSPEEIKSKTAKMAASNINRKILIAGTDNGGRADLMIILCFTKENEAKIFTVARDTYMQLNPNKKYNIDGKVRDFCKCNRSSYDSMDVLLTELNRHLDLDIKEYIALDWTCIATLVDALPGGGLEANVESRMLDWINQGADLGPYGVKNYKIPSAGKQTLKGWQAVQYLRVRKYEGGDARVREARNLEVFEKLYKQAQGWDLGTKMRIYNAISGRIRTNITPAGMVSLVEQVNKNINVVKAAGTSRASQYPFNAKNYWDKWADMYYFVPITLESNTIRLHKEFLGQNGYVPSATVKSLSKTIAKHVKKKVIVAKKPKVPSIAKASVTVGPAAYTGKAVTPSIVVKLKKKKLKATYYTVMYGNNVNIGKARITIEGRCGYGGSKTITFDIKPAGTRLTGITAGAKSFTTTWEQQAVKMPIKTIDGYQIQYGLKKNFKKAKTLTVSGYTNTTATVGKLKAKKKYYVRVRTYVGSGKNAVYSDWSAAKTVKPTK